MEKFLSAEYISFFLISMVVILTSLIAVLTSDIKKALFSLFFSFFGIAGYYVLLYSEFLAIAQVMIYVGAILILLLFAALLLDFKFLKGESPVKQKILSGILILFFFITILTQVIFKSTWAGENRVIKKSFDFAKSIGEILLSDEFILFECAGVLMLVSLIGASVMIKKED